MPPSEGPPEIINGKKQARFAGGVFPFVANCTRGAREQTDDGCKKCRLSWLVPYSLGY